MKHCIEGTAIASKRNLLLCLFLLLSAYITQSFGQTEAVIKNYYTEINNKISASLEQGYEGSLYQNQLVINKNGKSWPAVGFYADTINFWYSETPAEVAATEQTLKQSLVKVITSRRIAAHAKASEEYLYKKGVLIFYYSYWAEEGNTWQTRVYFNTKGLAFKSTVKLNEKELSAKELLTIEFKDQKPNVSSILNEAKKYQAVFFKSR